MALTLTRFTDLRSQQDEEEEKKKKTSGSARLKAAMESENVPQPTKEPEAKTEEPTRLSGSARLQAAMEAEPAKTPEAKAPQVSNTYREVDKEKGRIRTRSADLSTPSWQDDPDEMAAETRSKGNALQLTQNALSMAGAVKQAAGAKKQYADEAVNLYAQSIQKYEGILANEKSTAEERRIAQKNLEYLKPEFSNLQQSAMRAAQDYAKADSTYNAGSLRLGQLQESFNQSRDRYVKALGLGEAKAKEYEKQAQSLRSEADKQYRSGQANYQALRQAESLEAKAADSRGQYASYLTLTKGEEAANRYAAGEREKEETTGFGKKVLNTIAGLGANFFSGIGGASTIMMSRLMELPEDALYAITKNETFNLNREPYLRNSKALEASDPFRETANELKERAGKLGGMIIDTGYAAGNMMGVGGLTGQVTGALANTGLMTKLTSIAESSPLLTSPAARRGAQMAVNALRNPGNLGVSLSSGVNSYSEALANGASFSQAMANGLWKGLTEYVSNKMFSGTPLEDIPGEKGYVTKAIEFVADKLGKSDTLRALNQKTGGKVLNWLFDKAGEGLEEVITGVFDPIIDRLTYDTEAEWAPKLDALTDEFIGGVLLSLMMTGGEAAMTGAVNLSTNKKIADYLVENWGIEQAEARKYAPQIRKALKATQDATEAVRQAETPAQQTTPESTLARIVQKVTRGEAITGQDARRILADPEAMQALMDGGYLGGKVSNDSEGRKEIVAAAEQYAEDNATRGTDNTTQDIDNATRGIDNATRGIDNATEANISPAETANATKANTPPVPVQGLKLPTAEEKAPVQESKLRLKGAEETEIERDARAIQEYIDFANSERATENNAQIGAENAQNPEKPLSGIERLNAAREKESKTVQRTLATERQKTTEKAVSLRDAGFTTAAEEATARIRAEEGWDAEEKAVGQALRDLGYEPTFAVGLIQNAEGDTVPFLVDGNKIAIRADHRSQSIQQIAENAVGQSLNIEQGIRTSAVEAINQAKEAQKAPETPKVTPRAQAVLDSAREAGASQEDADLAARLSDMLGFDIRFFNDAGKNGARKNGYFENGTLYINTQSNRTLPWIVGHELTHGTEASRYYDSLKKLARKTLGLNWENKVQSKLSTTARAAERLGDESVRVDRDGAEREVVADFFADRLLTDEAAIRAVCEYQPTTARGIRDYIKKLLNKLGGKQSTLEKAVEMYNKALKDVAAKAQAEAQSKLKLKGTEGTKPKTSAENVRKYSLNTETIDYAVNYTAGSEEAKNQLRLLEKDITELGNIQDRINKEAGGRAAKNIHDLNDYLQNHMDVWQQLWDMQQELFDAGIRCDFVTEPGSPNVIDDAQVPGGLKGLPIEYVESKTGKRYKFTAFWRNMPQMLLDSMSHDSREKLRKEIMKGVEDAYARRTGETDLLPYFKDQFPTAREVEKVAGARTIKNIRNQTQSRVQAPIRDAEKTVAALNLNSACPMFTIGNNGCYLDACYLTQMANGATGTNLFRSAWYTGELLQISDADIQRMNELGGLRVNGVGDTTMDNKSQLKDALRHAGMRGLKVKIITKQRASLDVLAEMYNSGTDVSHITVQPSMDNLWIPAKLDDVYGAGVRGTTELAKTVDAGRNEAAASGYDEMFGRATKIENGVLYRKYGFTPEQIREMKEDFPFVQITPRYVVCTAAEIAEIALNRNGDYVNGGKLIQTLMHGKVPAGCVSDYPGEIINFGGARHVVARKDGKWHFYGEFIGKSGQVGKIIDGPNTPYGKVQRYVEENYTKAEQDKIWLTLKNQMCCQANDFKDACAGCQSLCARGCAAFSSEDFDYTKYSLKDKAQAMEMDERPAEEGLKMKSAPEAKAQGSGLKIGGNTRNSAENEENRGTRPKRIVLAEDRELETEKGKGGKRQFSVDVASDLYRTENDFTQPMTIDEFRDKIKEESKAESYFPKGLSEKFLKAITRKSMFNRTKLYRGIEAAELDYLMENGFLKSNGSYNFDNQQGQTMADEDPGYALSYATGFAPKEIAAKHYEDGQPSYLVEFLNAPNLNVSKNEVQESYTYDTIDQDYITRIFEIEYDPNTKQDMVRDVTDEMRNFLPNIGKGLAEAAHGAPMFFRDKTTGTILYAVQGKNGWEDGRYISEKDPSMAFTYEQMNSPVFSKHAPDMLGISGNEADLEAMTVGKDGTLVPESKTQYSVDSDDEYRETAGTPALEKLGIRLAGSKGKYHLAEQLLERDKAAKELMRATKKAEKKLNATKAEKEFAAGIAAGIYEERDIPKSMNRDKVTALADYYAAEDSFKTNMLAEVRDRINGELKQEAEDLLLHGDFNFKKLSMLQLNERTPDRTFRAMFGTQKGKEIFDWLIRPVQMNESEKTRWHQKQLDRVRKFKDAKGKTRALTRDESALTMLVMEGKAAAAAVADMEKKGLDAKGIRNAAENIRNGQDAGDAAQEFGLKDKERELAKNYATWMDTQDKLKDADSTIIEAAAEKYSKIFDEMYDAINDFLVAHGYEPIGYIKGYAPHMQPEETQNLLEKAFDKMGIDMGNDKAQGLPASIAGETAYFKPNKRWDPYFLHRTGTQAEYDIEKAYQSYVGYLSDILYHTDDIMRVRNFEKMLRKTYAPDEIREDLDMIQVIRDARPEDRQGMLRNQGKIGKTTQLSAQEVSEKLDEWEESLYNALKEDRNYNNLVMWLSNYANILAGKQSFADRGWEYSLGRNSLNFANRLQAAFQRSLVAGSLSSAINQTAQLPMIKTELGDRWYYKALTDILTGKTKGFRNDSDFLTTKHGVDMLTTDNYDKFINAIFTPSNLVDNLVSTVAVRGAYLKNINKGMSYSEAMRAADDFGRKVMGSREKGTRPLAYESKGLFSRMVHMFQVEAANSWDHIASDLPYEIRQIAKTQGKTKAATTLAALLIRGLLSAFLLNRATEEIYGGTPAPFDVIGLATNFVASGQGMTTNAYLKKIIDNGLEKIGQDRFFGTEDVPVEFNTGSAIEETLYNVMNDVPFARNVAGVLGLGDQSVPLPGAGGEFTDVGTAVKDLIDEGADAQTIENLIRASVKLGAQFAPAGRQITKTAEGIEAAIKGGSYSKKGKLQYSIDTPADEARAVLFGKNATQAAQEHWASGEKTLSENQTALVSTMRGWGMSGAESRKVINDISSFEAETDPDTGKTINGSKKAKVVEYIDGLKQLTSKQKDQLYLAQGYAESGLDETPWHKGGGSGKGKTYAPADTGKLRLPPSARMDEQDRELWDMESHGGNVNLRTRKTIPVTRDNIETVRGWGMDSRVGDYMTVASQTYRDGDRAVVVTPILPDGSLMTQKELDAYMDSLRGSADYADADDRGIILGVFDNGSWQQNLRESDAFAERIHELHEEREEKRKATGLKLPSAPQARPTQSGLKLR